MQAGTLATRFEHFAATQPEALAIVGEDRSLTYGALNALADRIAFALASLPSRPDDVLGLMMREGAFLVAAMLGAIKAGRIFIPFEMAAPEAWLSEVIADSGVTHILADEHWLSMAERASAGRAPVLKVEALEKADPGSPLPPREISDMPALVIYTSGSSGKPKGVAVSHATTLHTPDIRGEILGVGASDRIANLRPSATLAGVANYFLALTRGASIYPLNVRNYGLHRLAAWLADNDITGITFSGSLLRTWLSSLPEDRQFPKLRFVIATAEPMYESDLRRLSPHLCGDWRVMHTLASSEAGLMTVEIFDRSSRPEPGLLPVGSPVRGTEIRIEREDGTPADPGETGEVVVRSRALAAGYWKNQAATDAAFSFDPLDPTMRVYRSGDLGRLGKNGSLELQGRKGRRLKLRGYTVEPYQVERALLQLPGVHDAAVLLNDKDPENPRLVAYVVAPGRHGAEIRSGVGKALPQQLVPSDIVLMEKLPMTSRGKVDRSALPLSAPAKIQRQAYRPPADDYQRSLASIWQDILKIEQIGLDDDFYDLGGTSLQAFSIFARIAKELGGDLPPTVMVKAPTIARQADILRKGGRRVGQDAKLVAFREKGRHAPLFIVHAAFGDIMFVRDLARDLAGDRPVYGVQPAPLNGKNRLPRSVKTLATDYLAEIRRLQPKGPYYFAGYSFGGWVAFEMAQQARQQGETVAFLGIIDTRAAIVETPGNRVSRHLKQIRGQSFASYIGRRVHKTAAAVLKGVCERLHHLPSHLRLAFGLPLPYGARMAFYNFVFRRAGGQYVMRPYDGHIVLCGSADRARAHHTRWTPLAKGGLTIYEFATDHYGIVWPPHSTEVARHFDRHLEG